MQTITIKGYNRLNLLEHTIQSLLNPYDIKNVSKYYFIVHLDYCLEQPEVKRIVDILLNPYPHEVICSNNRIGYKQSHVNVLNRAASLNSDYNLDFDDDYHIYEGWSDLVEFYTSKLMPLNPHIFCGCLLTYYPKEWIQDIHKEERSIELMSTFGNHGTVTQMHFWKEGYGQHMSEYIKGSGAICFEGETHRWMQENNLIGARPRIGRLTLEPNNGLNYTTKFIDEYRETHLCKDCHVSPSEFRVIDIRSQV